MKSIVEIIKSNLDFLLKVLIFLLVLYLFFFILKPTTSLTYEDRKKLDSLNNRITTLTQQQKKLDSTISYFEKDITKVIDSVSKIKQEKIIIRKIYYEEINRVSNFTDGQVDSFFANKYGFTPR